MAGTGRSLRCDIAGRLVQVAFPADFMGADRALFEAEKAEFEAVFGAPVRFVDVAPVAGPPWVVDVDEGCDNTLIWDSATLTMTSRVKDAAGWAATVQMLHSLVTLDTRTVSASGDQECAAAATRVGRELEHGFPGFVVRGLTWASLREQFPADKDLSLEDLIRLVARLQDGHTAVRRRQTMHHPPYAVSLGDGVATLRRVPRWSSAAAAGVTDGWTLDVGDVASWLETVGGPPHSHPWLAGRRAIALPVGACREFVATSPTGKQQSWSEAARPPTSEQLFDVATLFDECVYVRLANWVEGRGIDERFDAVLRTHSHREELVLDLRGNTGGSLAMAQRWRRRFLKEPTLLGSIQFTRGDGMLADPVLLWDEPTDEARWKGRLTVLTDPLTFSASEDFLHGLHGLDHVTVIGWPSGGGSGRPRTVPLIAGWDVTISTALTFERTGHCIEARGIPVDVLSDPFTDEWRDLIGESRVSESHRPEGTRRRERGESP